MDRHLGFVLTVSTALLARKKRPVHHVATSGCQSGADDAATGTAKNLPPGTHVWLLVHRKGIALWWPQVAARPSWKTTVSGSPLLPMAKTETRVGNSS